MFRNIVLRKLFYQNLKTNSPQKEVETDDLHMITNILTNIFDK